jgi:hypothetical protein
MQNRKVRRVFWSVFILCIIIFLTISGFMTWKDWSYFKSQPYLRDSEIPSDMIVLYYSRSGKTEAMARQIAQRFNADIFKISDQSYYQGLLGILRANRDAWFQKSAQIATEAIDFKKYRLIFVGSPIWWYRPAPPLGIFVQNNRKSNKNLAING